MQKDATDQPGRFKRAVRAACCDACNWPECGCETVAAIAREAINSWNDDPPHSARVTDDPITGTAST